MTARTTAAALIGIPAILAAGLLYTDRYNDYDIDRYGQLDPPTWQTPDNACPTEDSCTIDYHDGRWTVTATTP